MRKQIEMSLEKKIVLITSDNRYVQGQVFIERIEKVTEKSNLLTKEALDSHRIFNKVHQKKLIGNKGATFKLILSHPVRYHHQLLFPPSKQRNVYLDVADITMPIIGFRKYRPLQYHNL